MTWELDYSGLFDPCDADFRTDSDGHPAPRADEFIAQRLAEDVGLID